MKKLPVGLVLVAIFQFIPIVIMPVNILKGMGVELWTPVLALFALLGCSCCCDEAGAAWPASLCKGSTSSCVC